MAKEDNAKEKIMNLNLAMVSLRCILDIKMCMSGSKLNI